MLLASLWIKSLRQKPNPLYLKRPRDLVFSSKNIQLNCIGRLKKLLEMMRSEPCGKRVLDRLIKLRWNLAGDSRIKRLCGLFTIWRTRTAMTPSFLFLSGLVWQADELSGSKRWSPASEPETAASGGWSQDSKRGSRPITGENPISLRTPAAEWIPTAGVKEPRRCRGGLGARFHFGVATQSLRQSGSNVWTCRRPRPFRDLWVWCRRDGEEAEREGDRAGERGVCVCVPGTSVSEYIEVLWAFESHLQDVTVVQRNFVAVQMIYIGLKFSLGGGCAAINFAQQSRAEHFISRTSALSLLISFYNATLATVNLPYLVRLLSCRGSLLPHLPPPPRTSTTTHSLFSLRPTETYTVWSSHTIKWRNIVTWSQLSTMGFL